MTSDVRLIDETVALGAVRLVAPTRPAGHDEVARLRAAVRADLPAVDQAARRWCELGETLPPTTCRVVGRVGWARANLTALRGAFDPLRERLSGNRALASRVLGAQIGALLGLLSTKVLGQYVLPLARPGAGQLLVVGPNLLDLADEAGPLSDDIRRTVLLHEVTHRLQFEGVEWLGGHLRALLTTYLEHSRLDPGALIEAAARLPEAIVRARETGTVQPLLESVLTAEQRAVVTEAQALMSLLEGHGNAAMYGGSEGVIADPAGVREALQRRRADVAAKILTAVAGLDMKKRQYLEGEAFVRAVVDEVGVAGLNAAFAAPENLPTHDEVKDPRAWIDRVLAA